MKKIFTCLLCFVLAVTLLASCSKKSSSDKVKSSDNELEVGESYVVKDFAKFTLLKVFSTPKISPSMGGYLYYETDSEYETYVDVVFDWTNTSGEAVEVQDLIAAKAINEKDKEYTEFFNVMETNNGTDLDQYSAIEPETSVRLHCAITVPTSSTDLTLEFEIQKKKYVFEYTLGNTHTSADTLSIGDEIKAPNNATLLFFGTEYTDDLLPSNTDGIYTHYAIDDPENNTYLVVRYDITSDRATEADCDSFVNITALYANKYSYTGFVVVEDEDGMGFSAYENIAPLSTRHLCYLIKVPKTVTEEVLELTIVFDNYEYIYSK